MPLTSPITAPPKIKVFILALIFVVKSIGKTEKIVVGYCLNLLCFNARALFLLCVY
jgi:hypothetical protein